MSTSKSSAVKLPASKESRLDMMILCPKLHFRVLCFSSLYFLVPHVQQFDTCVADYFCCCNFDDVENEARPVWDVVERVKQEAQLMPTTGSTRLAVSRGQQTWYHSTRYI